jgi:hypothetical protein
MIDEFRKTRRNVNVEDTILAFFVGRIMTSVWNQIQDPEHMKRDSGVMSYFTLMGEFVSS